MFLSFFWIIVHMKFNWTHTHSISLVLVEGHVSVKVADKNDRDFVQYLHSFVAFSVYLDKGVYCVGLIHLQFK